MTVEYFVCRQFWEVCVWKNQAHRQEVSDTKSSETPVRGDTHLINEVTHRNLPNFNYTD